MKYWLARVLLHRSHIECHLVTEKYFIYILIRCLATLNVMFLAVTNRQIVPSMSDIGPLIVKVSMYFAKLCLSVWSQQLSNGSFLYDQKNMLKSLNTDVIIKRSMIPFVNATIPYMKPMLKHLVGIFK